MTHSFTYRVYNWFKNIYNNSKFINFFSNGVSYTFHVIVSSKIFSILTHKTSRMFFQESVFFNSIKAIVRKFFDISRETVSFKKMLDNSYYVKLSKNILSKKDKKAINSLLLLFVFSLLFDIIFKLSTGNFTMQSNKTLIVIMGISIFLYILKLDYPMILKESKVVHLFNQILEDERNVGEKNNE